MTTAKSSGQGNRTSAIKCHLPGSASCREWYSDDVLSVLSHGRPLLHLAVFIYLFFLFLLGNSQHDNRRHRLLTGNPKKVLMDHRYSAGELERR